MEKELACPCQKPDCLYKGDCVDCFNNHMNGVAVLACMRPGNTTPIEVKQRVLARLKAAGVLDYGTTKQ